MRSGELSRKKYAEWSSDSVKTACTPRIRHRSMDRRRASESQRRTAEDRSVLSKPNLMGIPGIVEGRTAVHHETEGAAHHVNRTDQMVFGNCGRRLLDGHKISDFTNAVMEEEARDDNVAFGKVQLFRAGAVLPGRSEAKIPPLPASSSAPNTLGELKSGRQHQSIEPFLPTSATV
jgi:hypothetical protein